MSRRRRRRLRLVLLAGVALSCTGLALSLYWSDTLRRVELDTVDARFSLRGEELPPRDVVIVAIDDVTLESTVRVGERARLPRFLDWPRSYHARALRNLAHDGAQVIAYDIEFTEPSEDARQDLLLYEAARAARPVVFATTVVSQQGRSHVLGDDVGNDTLRAIGARAGHALLPRDPRGVLRRMPSALRGLRPFAEVVAEVVRGRPVPRAPLGATAWIDYAGPSGTFETISFARVLHDEFRSGTFRGRTVIVGPSAPSLQDVHATSASGASAMSGAEVQANAIATVMRGFPLRSVSAGWSVAWIALLGLIAPLASTRLGPLRSLGSSAAAGIGFVVAAQIAFQSGLVVAVVYPLVALLTGSAGSLWVHDLTEARERRRLRVLFSRFVPESVVDEVVDSAEGEPRLGGVELEVTVMFTDLRGFTSLSETLSAPQVIEVLNLYMGEMSTAILDHGGTLVSYLGDGILAVFGAPLEQPDHADRALATAHEMLEERLPRCSEWIRAEGLAEGFRMGIGLNSGRVMSGNVGSERRLEYTVVGDTVNTASRLEGMTKGTPHQIFVADSTRALLRNQGAGLELVGDLEVRGREHAIRVWTLPGGEDGSVAPPA